MKTPKEQLKTWILNKTLNEKDKRASGFKNQFFAFEDLLKELVDKEVIKIFEKQ